MPNLFLGDLSLKSESREIQISAEEPTSPDIQMWITPTDDNNFTAVPEAPIDGNLYGRKSGTWKKVNIPNLVSELDNTEKETIKTELGLISTVEEAPKDSNYYARKNGTWVNTSLNALAANCDESKKQEFLDTMGFEIVNHGTGDTNFKLTPNKYHIWGEVSQLQLSITTEQTTSVRVYAFQFTSGNTPTNLNLGGVKWLIEDFEIESNKVYQVTIMNGYAAIGGASV